MLSCKQVSLVSCDIAHYLPIIKTNLYQVITNFYGTYLHGFQTFKFLHFISLFAPPLLSPSFLTVHYPFHFPFARPFISHFTHPSERAELYARCHLEYRLISRFRTKNIDILHTLPIANVSRFLTLNKYYSLEMTRISNHTTSISEPLNC